MNETITIDVVTSEKIKQAISDSQLNPGDVFRVGANMGNALDSIRSVGRDRKFVVTDETGNFIEAVRIK